MISDIEIMEATREDWEEAMELAWITFLKFEAPEYDKEGTENFLKFISDERLYRMFLIGEYVLAVAKDIDGKIVGMVGVRSKNHVSLLFVDERYHRQGIARTLLSYVQNNVNERTGSCTMTVNSSPYGHDFYEKIGFYETGGRVKTDGIIYYPMVCTNRIVKK